MKLKKLLFSGTQITSLPANIGLSILRISAGLFLAFGHGIFKVPPSDKFVSIVSNLHFPFPVTFAWFSGIAEFFCGIFLALGFLTRPSALFVVINMAVAAFLAHGADTFGRKELALLYEIISLTFLFIGSTKFGVDNFILKRK